MRGRELCRMVGGYATRRGCGDRRVERRWRGYRSGPTLRVVCIVKLELMIEGLYRDSLQVLDITSIADSSSW